MILKQNIDDGISKFMKRVSGGYARYFNEQYSRTGALFQGPFKSIYIDTNEYMLYVSAYIRHGLPPFGYVLTGRLISTQQYRSTI
jgi:hypothetical protein